LQQETDLFIYDFYVEASDLFMNLQNLRYHYKSTRIWVLRKRTTPTACG